MMALALLGKCVALLGLVLLFYTCCYAFRIRDGGGVGVAHSSPMASPIVEQRATCAGLKFGRCPEKTITTSSGTTVTPSPRRWHEAMSSRAPPIARKPPVETHSAADDEDADILESASRLVASEFADSSIGINEEVDYDEEDEESEDVEDSADDDDGEDDIVVEDEEEEIQAEDDSGELSEVELSENDEEDIRDSESIEGEAKGEVEEEDDDGSLNVLGWSFKLSGIGVPKPVSSKDTVDDDEGKGKRSSMEKDSVKGDVKVDGESSIRRKEQSKIEERDRSEDDDEDDEEEEEEEDDDENEDESEDKSRPSPPMKLEKVRYADKNKVRSVERIDSKSTEKVEVEAKKPVEKVRRDVQEVPVEAKKVEAAKAVKSEPGEEKRAKKADTVKVTKAEGEAEKKARKSGSVESIKSEVDEVKKAKKTEPVKPAKAEPESSKATAATKLEEKRKLPAKTETPKAAAKAKEQAEKSDQRKVKREVPETARDKTKSKTKKHGDATKSLLELNDEILHVPTFVPNFTTVENTNCQQHGKIFLRQLRGHKLWALQMLDSSAKIPASLLRGNINQFGDFDQCLGIVSHVKMSNKTIKIQGKYCLAYIDIHATLPDMKLPVHLMLGRGAIKSSIRDPGHFSPRFMTAHWALCLPATCTAKDAESTLVNALSYYNVTSGITFSVHVDPNMCYVKQKTQSYSKETIGVLYFYAAVVCLALVATIRDYLIVSEKKGNYSERIIMSFSLRRTLKSLFKEPNPNSSDIGCLHGLRAVSMIMIYALHRMIPIMHIPYANRTRVIDFYSNPISCILRGGALYTDTFLVLSGLLSARNMVKELQTRGEIRWFCRYIARIVRLTPALVVVIFWYAFVMEHIGSGPHWNNVIAINAELCRKNSWTNFLYIQNFFPMEEMCATHTHQLALDMQLTILAPILVFFLYNRPIIGIILSFFLIQVSATCRYIAMMYNYLSIYVYHGVSIKQLYKTGDLTYTVPLHRVTPYISGVALGVLLHHTGKNVKIHKVFVILGWLIAAAFGFWSFFYPWRFNSKQYLTYDVEEATHYGVMSPVLWSITVSWTIFACFTGHGGIINSILSNYWMVVLSRLSYAIYITQFMAFLYNIATVRYSSEAQANLMIDPVEVIEVILVSIVVTLLFDTPMQEIKNVIMESTDRLNVVVPAEKPTTDEANETNAKKSAKKIGNGAKVFEDDEVTSTGWDWQQDIIGGSKKIRDENLDDEEIVDMPRLKRPEERRKSFIGRDDDEERVERGRVSRSSQRTAYTFDSDEEAMEYYRAKEEEESTRNSRRSHSRTRELKRSAPMESEDDYARRRKEEVYSNQYRRSESRERRPVREPDDHRSWEFVNKERSASAGPDPRRFLTEPEEYASRISRRSVPKSVDSRRTFSSEREEEGPVQRRSKNERRYPSVEPKVSDEEGWEEELRIRRRQFMEKLASQRSGSVENVDEEDIVSLRRRSSAEGRIALLKDPSGNENMDAWTVSVGPRIAQLGSSQEPSEAEDETVYLQRREYREKAPPFRENPYSEKERASLRDDEDTTSFNFVLTKDSRKKSLQDLTKLSQEDSDLADSGWSLVKDESIESLPKSSLGLFKRESIIKSQASEEDPEYYLPERPKLVQQEEEHPFKKAWQMQKSRSEEDAYIVKDKKLSQSEARKDEDSSASKKDTSGGMSEDSRVVVSDETEELSVWQNRSTDTEDNQQSSKSEMSSDIDPMSARHSSPSDFDDGGPCAVSEIGETTSFIWASEDEQFERYKQTGARRKSMETNWDWEEEET